MIKPAFAISINKSQGQMAHPWETALKQRVPTARVRITAQRNGMKDTLSQMMIA